jgi:FkbM family methyltransferase
MKPQELRRRYREGTLGKPEYIRAMCVRHQVLFEYSGFLAGTDIAAIQITPQGVEFQLRDPPVWMACPAGEARVAPVEILNFGQYEPAETRALLPLVRDARMVLDIGANIGWFALWFASHCAGARVHAFEPVPRNVEFLARNVARNALEHRISVHSLGLSERAGTHEFFVYPTGSTNASMLNVAAVADPVRVVAAVERLDDWAARTGVAPDCIKCDVEGAELLVFRGGERVLREHRPVVFAEMLRKWARPFGYHPNDMIDFFSGLEYRCYSVSEAGLAPFRRMTDASVETNFVFLSRERAELLEGA